MPIYFVINKGGNYATTNRKVINREIWNWRKGF